MIAQILPSTPLFRVLIPMFFLLLGSCSLDPCEDKVCYNGGVCVDGDCDCPEGYTGSDCGTQVIPRSMQILKIAVLRFPFTEPNGAGWDLTSGPDLFPYLSYNGIELYDHPSFTQNAVAGIRYEFIPASPLILTNPQFQYSISLWDYDDFDPNDHMGSIHFIPFSVGNDFPSTIVLDPGGKVAFELEVSYTL